VITDYLAGLVAAVLSYLAPGFLPPLLRGPIRPNHRGRMIPVILGTAVTASLSIVMLAGLAGDAIGGRTVFAWIWTILALLLVYAAGRYDDLQTERHRGVVAQLALLARGRITTGIVKLAAGLAAGLVWVLATRSPLARAVVGVPLIAGCCNLWNLLDVAPGRSGKFFLAAAIPMEALRRSTLVAAGIGAVAGILWSDLEERAMLGDAGANVLGLVAGIGLFDRLGLTGLWVALGAVIGGHVLSETVTLSRIIRTVPPLRWFDDLGRIRHPETEDSTST
jgi:UDP-GlcNAc:undecaprenyl-phosphate/decaprenyl-phosphate GlcNAc-1-phosphate transferase